MLVSWRVILYFVPRHKTKVKFICSFLYFKLSEGEVVSIIIILQVKLCSFLCHTVSYALLNYFAQSTYFELCECDDVSIYYYHGSIPIQVFFWLHGFMSLFEGVGVKLSRAVYLAPHLQYI